MSVGVCFVRLAVFVCAYQGKCVLCERGAQRGAVISCVQVTIFEGWQGGGCEDMSALCVGTPRYSLLIHCSPAPTNR